MSTNYTISERTNKLLNIMAEFERVNEELLIWIMDDNGEDSQLINELDEHRSSYLGFMQHLLGEQVRERMGHRNNKEI